jgi:hypothetical protein
VFADDEDAAQARLRGRIQPFDVLITDMTEPDGPFRGVRHDACAGLSPRLD